MCCEWATNFEKSKNSHSKKKLIMNEKTDCGRTSLPLFGLAKTALIEIQIKIHFHFHFYHFSSADTNIRPKIHFPSDKFKLPFLDCACGICFLSNVYQAVSPLFWNNNSANRIHWGCTSCNRLFYFIAQTTFIFISFMRRTKCADRCDFDPWQPQFL